jgi:hypothetical protein
LRDRRARQQGENGDRKQSYLVHGLSEGGRAPRPPRYRA